MGNTCGQSSQLSRKSINYPTEQEEEKTIQKYNFDPKPSTNSENKKIERNNRKFDYFHTPNQSKQITTKNTLFSKSGVTYGELIVNDDQAENQCFSAFFDLIERPFEEVIEDKTKLNESWFLKQQQFFSDQFHKKDLEEEHSNNHFLETELFDISTQTHQPTIEYAIPVQEDFDLNFNYNSDVQIALKNLRPLKVPKVFHSELPLIDIPYFIFELNTIYIGQWKFGKPNNIGKMYHQDGWIEEGIFRDGELHGFGRIIQKNGIILEGQFYRGLLDGIGKILKPDGMIYQGQWKDGIPEGYGKEAWANGLTYEGSYHNGQKSGKGELTWRRPDDSITESYQGDFEKGQFHGFGIFKWRDGRFYQGQWKEGKMNGKGLFRWKDGRQYEGNYLNDEKHGYGTFTWPGEFIIQNSLNQRVCLPIKQWRGTWKNGKMDGKGELWFKGVCYTGEWKQGTLLSQSTQQDVLQILERNKRKEVSILIKSNRMLEMNLFD